eukprot:11778504-Alexandrium_andersonii.AAC.1
MSCAFHLRNSAESCRQLLPALRGGCLFPGHSQKVPPAHAPLVGGVPGGTPPERSAGNCRQFPAA